MHEDVLIVDDDPDMVEAVSFVLQSAGYSTRGARNGEQALAAVAQSPPRLVLLDMWMPVMDGRQCARLLRARYARLPIVLVTAAEHVASLGEGIGANAVLPKPFDVDALLHIVGRMLQAPASSMHP